MHRTALPFSLSAAVSVVFNGLTGSKERNTKTEFKSRLSLGVTDIKPTSSNSYPDLCINAYTTTKLLQTGKK